MTKRKEVKKLAQPKTKQNVVSNIGFKKHPMRKDNQAVSAVIGVILMVAITVILAAIIGVFVMNMSGNLPKMPGYAAFECQRVQNASNFDTLTIVNVATNGEPITVIELKVTPVGGDDFNLADIVTTLDLSDLNAIGGEVSFELPAELNGAFELTIIGKTSDGGTNILQTFNVDADSSPAP